MQNHGNANHPDALCFKKYCISGLGWAIRSQFI